MAILYVRCLVPPKDANMSKKGQTQKKYTGQERGLITLGAKKEGEKILEHDGQGLRQKEEKGSYKGHRKQ